LATKKVEIGLFYLFMGFKWLGGPNKWGCWKRGRGWHMGIGSVWEVRWMNKNSIFVP